MSLYHRASQDETVFLALTGLTFCEFDQLKLSFQAAWEEEVQLSHQKNPRERQPGGGRKSVLRTSEDRLFFILYYLKTYPFQEVIAFHFEMSQGQANEWIYRLSKVLWKALDDHDVLPERQAERLRKRLQRLLNASLLLMEPNEGDNVRKPPRSKKTITVAKRKSIQ